MHAISLKPFPDFLNWVFFRRQSNWLNKCFHDSCPILTLKTLPLPLCLPTLHSAFLYSALSLTLFACVPYTALSQTFSLSLSYLLSLWLLVSPYSPCLPPMFYVFLSRRQIVSSIARQQINNNLTTCHRGDISIRYIWFLPLLYHHSAWFLSNNL